MSDEPETTTTDDTPQKQYGIAWGDEIDETRKQELWARLRAWWDEADHGERKGPFAGVLLTGAEVYWLAVCALTKLANIDIDAPEQMVIPQGVYPLDLSLLCLQNAVLIEAQLSDSNFYKAQLQGAMLWKAQLQGANLRAVQADSADFTSAQLQNANLSEAQLQRAKLTGCDLRDANLQAAQLQEVKLDAANLQSANLYRGDLSHADLREAQVEEADLRESNLTHADLRQASFDKKTRLNGAVLTNVRLDGVILDNTNLTVVDWTIIEELQDEYIARQEQFSDKELDPEKRGKRKPVVVREEEYQAAARAYRRLAVALQANGMSEEAAKYAYRAQLMQRAVYRYSGWRALGQWLFSWFLWLIAGYGYRPGRSVVAYLASVALFAVGYYALGVTVGPHLSPYEAAVVSLTAFHGRGFFATAFKPSDPQAGLAALEAVFGLLIEISFIATFTQRFFGAK